MIKFILLFVSILSVGCNQSHELIGNELNPISPTPTSQRNENPTDPKTNNEQAIGFYSKGTLEFPNELTVEGPGFIKLFLWRDRAFSSLQMHDLIESVANKIRDLFPKGERLQIGDMSNEHGGSIGLHLSHQNGLDADIAYYRTDYQEQDKATNGFAISFVSNGSVTKLFDVERNWILMKQLVATQQVNRLFVDIAIKKKLCDYAKSKNEFDSQAETLRRLRVWENHSDHVHVRINCPLNGTKCITQEAPPIGQGCDLAALQAFDANEVGP